MEVKLYTYIIQTNHQYLNLFLDKSEIHHELVIDELRGGYCYDTASTDFSVSDYFPRIAVNYA